MRHFWADVRFGIRMVFRYRTLSIASILTFGLGIGLATTVFSIVNGTMYKGLPFEEAERFVAVARSDVGTRENLGDIAVHDFAVYEASQRVFEAFGAWSVGSVNLVWGQGQAERFQGASMTVGALDATRVKPVLGRTFRAGEDRPGAERVVLIGYRLWRDRFGGSPDVIGRSVRANGIARTIVGVMPERFAFPDREQLWMPLEIDPLATARGQGPSYDGVARLRAGVSIEEAQAQMSAIAARLAREFPEINRTTGVAVMPFLKRVLGASLFALCYTMLGAGIGVLLIACANVSNLLIARASLRQREVAVRLAIGAGRGRVLSQMLTEVTLLALAGALLGVAINEAAIRWFVAAVAKNPPPFFITFDTDWRVLLFVTSMAFAASLAAGLLPAWQATRVDAMASLRDESRAATGFRVGRLRSALVVVEITMSCALLIGAGLMVKSVVQVKATSLPFSVDGILTAWVQLPGAVYPDAASRLRLVERLLPRLREVAGVESATVASDLPANDNIPVPIVVSGRSYDRASDLPVARFALVTPGYFSTFGVGIARGRDFTALDGADRAPVAVVNESFVRQVFQGANPIGRTIRQGPADSKQPWLTIVGVVPDLLMQGFRTGLSGAGYYTPAAQSTPGDTVAIAVRMRRGTRTTSVALQAALASVDRDLAVFNVQTMQALIDVQTMFYSVFGSFFMAFGAAGLFLAAAGLYGVIAFSVTQRTREFGIRSALGARGGQLLLLVLRKAAWQSLIGLTLGVVLALLAGDPLARILYEVHPRDPVVVSVVVATLAGMCLLAGLIAARRLIGMDPATALGNE